MKTKLIRLSFLLITSLLGSELLACDLCNLYLSMNPYDFKHSLSINYRTVSQQAIYNAGPQFSSGKRSSGSRHSDGSYFFEDTKVQERFQTIDLWGKFMLSPKIQLAVNVPLEYNDYRYNGTVETETQGIGDITALGIYQVYNTKTDTNNTWRQRFSVGGGLKLPTGNFKALQDDELISEDMQTGSGSLDFLLLTNYTVRYKKLGFRALVTYKINGQNNLDYSFANGTNLTGALFYQWNVFKKFVLMPEAGMYYEQAERDSRAGEVVLNTGGKVLYSTYGVKLIRMPFVLEFNYQHKIDEELYDVQMPNDNRFFFGITYNISNKYSY